jgi:hypothetical protein
MKDTIELILTPDQELMFPESQLEELKAKAASFPYKLDPPSSKALQSRLKALRKSKTDVTFSISGLDFHQMPPSYESSVPILRLYLDGEDCFIDFSPERAEVFADMITASSNEHDRRSVVECPIFSQSLEDARAAEERAKWERLCQDDDIEPLDIEIWPDSQN